MSIHRIAKKIWKKILAMSAILFLCIVLFFAVFVALIRLESPVVKSETPRIQTLLSRLLQHPVEVKSISLSWHGLMPVIDIEQFKIYSTDHLQTLFSAGEIFTRIKILDSLYHRRIQLGYLYVNYMNLLFAKDEQNHWQPVNLSPLLQIFSNAAREDFSDNFLFEANHIGLGVQKIFPHYLPIQNIKANIELNKNNQNFELSIKKLKVSNPQLSVIGKLDWRNNQINFDLNYDLTSKIVPALNNYLPHIILDENLIQWLTESIKSFDSIRGFARLHQGEFYAQFSVNNLSLQYDPLWPAATNVNAKLDFGDQTMDAIITSGKLLETPIKQVFIHIPDLKNTVLNIRGQVQSLAKNLLNFVHQSPLQKTVGQYVKSVNLDGNALLDINIQIPLAEKKAVTRVNGVLTLSQNSGKVFNDISVQDIDGEIRFNEEGLTGKSLKAVLWNKPFKAMIYPEKYVIEYPGWNMVVHHAATKGFRASIDSPTMAGYLDFTDKKIIGKFQYLILGDKQNNKTNDKDSFTVRPEKIPALDVIINRFEYHHKAFGQVKLRTVAISNGLKLESLQSRLDPAIIQMTGVWNSRGSSVTGFLKTNDSAKTLKNWQLSESLQSSSAKLDYQLNWQGALYHPALKTLSGKLHLSSGAGELLVGSQAKNDLGRLLTILSFQSLAKRMQLDFSDFAKSGLNFDSITGDFVLSHGVASTNNLVIDGAVATIEMEGSIDLSNETYQLKFTVTPHLTASLPVVATLAGGPVAGAAAWAAGKIINPILNKITSDIYTVTGTWDNPIIHG